MEDARAVLVMGLLVMTLGFGGCQPSTYEVTYKVTGLATDKASITISNAQGGTEQSDIAVPWSETFTVQRGQQLYLSAQNKSEYGGTITCEIALKGHGSKTATSSGQFAIATCSGVAAVR